MKKIAKLIDQLSLTYVLPDSISMDDCLFMDIETTGFTARSSYLYLIGCIFHREDGFHLIQWFAESYESEKEILQSFLEFSAHFKYLIHFNGNHFDIPYLEQKAAAYNFACDLKSMQGIDIYKRLLPLKSFLKLPNLKQKTIEAYLGLAREDKYNGGELIGVYHSYVTSPSLASEQLLLLHNEEDMIGMVKILPILAVSDLYSGRLRVTKVNANFYTDYSGVECAELVMKLHMNNPVPCHVTCYENGCYFVGDGDTLTLKVPIYEEELKYFYSDYKSYYYLPGEDIALHKSVATFVDTAHREQAKASNCYTRKVSQYLEQWDGSFEPIFKRSYDDRKSYFELTDAFKHDREGFSKYASQVLHMMISSKNA